MGFRVTVFAADDGLARPRFLGHREAQPVVPQDGKVQVADVAPVGRVGQDVVHAGRRDHRVQRGRIAGQDLKIPGAVQRTRAARPPEVVIPPVQNFLLGREHVCKTSLECRPDGKLDAPARHLVTVQAEDAGTAPAGGPAPGGEEGLVELGYRGGPGQQQQVPHDAGGRGFDGLLDQGQPGELAGSEEVEKILGVRGFRQADVRRQWQPSQPPLRRRLAVLDFLERSGTGRADPFEGLAQGDDGGQRGIGDVSRDEVGKGVQVVVNGFPPQQECLDRNDPAAPEGVQDHVPRQGIAFQVGTHYVGRPPREIGMDAIVPGVVLAGRGNGLGDGANRGAVH